MGWADDVLSNAERKKFSERDQARLSSPYFVDLAGAVLKNLFDGFTQVNRAWGISYRPWLSFAASHGSDYYMSGILVSVNYSAKSFDVTYKYSDGRNEQKSYPVKHDHGTVTPQLVDNVARKLIGSILPLLEPEDRAITN